MSFWHSLTSFFNTGGIFMYPLSACSVVMIAVILYRAWNMRSSKICPYKLLLTLNAYTTRTIPQNELQQTAAQSNSVLGRLVTFALESQNIPDEELKMLLQSRAKREFTVLQNGLSLLDMIIMIAPMLGILGTASGLTQIFGIFGVQENHDLLAQGISQALNTTIAGLSIAVPAVIAHVYYSRKLERISVNMELLLEELLTQR